MPMIMVSYRRADQDIAGRIADHLIGKYGEKSVFFDVNSIRTGANFHDRITKAIVACDVVVCLIGPQWIGKTADGASRLDNPADSVRVEIETALQNKKPILPLLVNGAAMPLEPDLPEALRFLPNCNGTRVDSGQDFRMHMGRLIDTINEVLVESGSQPLQAVQAIPVQAPPPAPTRPYWIYGAAAAALALVLWFFAPTLEIRLMGAATAEGTPASAKVQPTVPMAALASVTKRAKAQGGYIFPDSDSRLLGESDLKAMSTDELRVARNEIYARHGRFFKDVILVNYFSQFSWYQPRTLEPPLSNIESANVATIETAEHSK